VLFALILAATGAAALPALPRWHISTNVLNIRSGDLAADFTIANDDRIGERFEISAASWSQNGGADRRRAAVDDVLIFPRLLELAPGESRRVRVGVLESGGDVESDYRVTVEQLFDPQPRRPGLHFLLAYDVPLFVAPRHITIDARILAIAVRNGRAVVTIRNDGNVHVFMRRIDLRWRGSAQAFRRPFYVLPHSTMAFTLATRACGSGTATVSADPESHVTHLRAPLVITCRSPGARASRLTRIVASLYLNHLPAGDAIVVCDPPNLYVRARDVAAVRFPRRLTTTRIGGEVYIVLASSGVSYVYDPSSLALDIEYRTETTQRLAIAVPTPALYSNGTSASVAYAASVVGKAPDASMRATIATPGGATSVGFANAGAVIYRTALDAAIFQRGQNGQMLLGDQTLAGGGTLPSLPIFGAGFTEGTLLRTSGERAPCERVTGRLRDPTAITIGVPGAEPIEVGVEPGSFAIDGVPVAARITAIDEVTNLPVQIAAEVPLGDQLVAPGWREIGVAAGTPRVCIYACATYRGVAGGGALLVGDSPFLASGPHLEYVDGLTGAGYDVVDADPHHALRFSAGVGPLDGVLGSYAQRAGLFSFNFGYGTSGAPFYDLRGRLVAPRRSLSQIADAEFRRLRFHYESHRYPSLGESRIFELVDAVSLFHSALQLDLRDWRAGRAPALFSLGLLLPLIVNRARDTTLLGTIIGAHQGRAALLASQLDTPGGFQVGADGSGDVRASYVSDTIEIAASTDRILTVSGAVAFLHGAHLVRDTSGGYAVIEGEPGDLVRDGDGRIHTVRSHGGTAFPLAPSDRPATLAYIQRTVTLDGDASLSATQLYPAPNAGVLIVITHRRLFAVIGRVADRRWRYGTIVLVNGMRSPIGSDEVFYFEELPAGAYRARIIGDGGSCQTSMIVPASRARQIDIGSIGCIRSP
jgi:P pilus assembly chaperone PapD